jgi:hypothetical protein
MTQLKRVENLGTLASGGGPGACRAVATSRQRLKPIELPELDIIPAQMMINQQQRTECESIQRYKSLSESYLKKLLTLVNLRRQSLSIECTLSHNGSILSECPALSYNHPYHLGNCLTLTAACSFPCEGWPHLLWRCYPAPWSQRHKQGKAGPHRER